jgi:peptide/nickel transport system substrate-binding protein
MGRKCKTGLTKNPLFYEKTRKECTALSRSCHYLLPDKQSGFLQFIQGKLDFTSGLDPSYKDDILTQKENCSPNIKKRINLITGPYLNTEYLVSDGRRQQSRIRLTHSSSDELRFRPSKMITYLRNNMGTPAVNGIIPTGLPSFNNAKGYTYDSEKQKDLVMSKKATGDKTL